MIKQVESNLSKQICQILVDFVIYKQYFLSGNNKVGGGQKTGNQNENNSEIGNVHALMGLNFQGIRFRGHSNPKSFKLI